MTNLKTLLPKVDCVRGAPMGRSEWGSFLPLIENKIGLCLRRVSLNQGGYDRGGAYWGGYDLWIAFSQKTNEVEEGHYLRQFVRAKSRAEAACKLGIEDYLIVKN